MLFALDADWWERYGAEAAGIFAGARVSTHRQTAKGVYRERLQYPRTPRIHRGSKPIDQELQDQYVRIIANDQSQDRVGK